MHAINNSNDRQKKIKEAVKKTKTSHLYGQKETRAYVLTSSSDWCRGIFRAGDPSTSSTSTSSSPAPARLHCSPGSILPSMACTCKALTRSRGEGVIGRVRRGGRPGFCRSLDGEEHMPLGSGVADPGVSVSGGHLLRVLGNCPATVQKESSVYVELSCCCIY